MLRFQVRPDNIFIDILDDAIANTIDDIDLEESSDKESLADILPRSSRFFTPQEAKDQLLGLQRASHADDLYQLTDYHWLLLYESLRSYCEYFNEGPIGPVMEKYGIESLDFGFIVDLFFWDTDFLDDGIGDLAMPLREAMAVSPETFGLALGMKPHPEELVLKPWDINDIDTDSTCLFMPGSKQYPSPITEEDN